MFLPPLYRALSSANNDVITLWRFSGRSLITMMNIPGDIFEPWEVPFSKQYTFERAAPTLTWNVRLVKKSAIYSNIWSLTPSRLSLMRSPFFHTISKAFSKSTNTAKRCPLFCCRLIMASWSLTIWSTVFRPRRNPVCILERSWCFSRYHINLLLMSFSINLHIAEVIDIGRYDDGSRGSFPAFNIGRLNCLHGAIPIAPAASDFPFRLLVDAVTHVLSVFRVCKVP